MKLLHMHHLCAAALLLLFGTCEAEAQKMLLSKVKTLTLRNGQMTKSRRVEPIPQLTCIGGDGQGLYEVDVMRCTNVGSDYEDEDVSWTCTADVPKYFKLGSTDVICEGYNGPDDRYVLKGSCGVEYRLTLTDAGYEKYGHSGFERILKKPGSPSSWFPLLFKILFGATVCLIIYSAICANQNNPAGRPPRRPGFFGGGGGGGGGPWFGGGGDDPPPPYDPRPPRYTYTKPRTTPATAGSGEGWRPGFWSGMAAGAAGSYLMNNNRTREQPSRPAPSGWFGGGSSSGGSGWGGGGSGFAESSSAGAARHSTSGFGQTRRR